MSIILKMQWIGLIDQIFWGGVKQVSELVGTTDITKRNKEKNKRIK